jgi:hypothetical protein
MVVTEAGQVVKGKSKAQGPGLGARDEAALPWGGLRRPRMRDKGGTLALPFTRGDRAKMAT